VLERCSFESDIGIRYAEFGENRKAIASYVETLKKYFPKIE
jgi:hypothetical protein